MQDGLGYVAIMNNLKISVIVSNQLFLHSQEMSNMSAEALLIVVTCGAVIIAMSLVVMIEGKR